MAVSGDTVVVGALWRGQQRHRRERQPERQQRLRRPARPMSSCATGRPGPSRPTSRLPTPERDDLFGSSVAVSGDTVVVGALQGGQQRHRREWQPERQQRRQLRRRLRLRAQRDDLEPAGLPQGLQHRGGRQLRLGSVASRATRSWSEPYGEASNATGVNGNQSDNSATNSGAAYVFVRSGTTWSQQAYLKASNTGARDDFGTLRGRLGRHGRGRGTSRTATPPA